jgi:AraC-like DNA-binding protein
MSSRLDRITNWEQFAAQSGYCLEEMARKCRMSSRQLRRYFQEHHGVPPKQWLDELRARAAVEQLARGDLVKTVSADLHYKQPSNFVRLFKRLKGTTPKNHRD